MKKKLLIPIILIVIIVIFLGIKAFRNYYQIKQTQKKEDDIKENLNNRINELIDKSYKYYLLKEGTIELDQYEFLVFGNTQYNLVKLDGIKSTDQIEELINDIFTQSFTDIRREDVYESREYINKFDNLYVNNQFDTCEVSYDLKNATFTIKDGDDVKYIEFEINEQKYLEFELYDENGTYKISTPFYECRYN